jgi:hypothetical protein
MEVQLISAEEAIRHTPNLMQTLEEGGLMAKLSAITPTELILPDNQSLRNMVGAQERLKEKDLTR